jgi:hypothetical protein
MWLTAALAALLGGAPWFPVQAQTSAGQHTIYLTFDDGPLPGSENILDVLRTERVPATLFMVGMHAEASPGRMALVELAKTTPLVAVGNHSYSHANNRYREFYSDTERVLADMQKANAVLGLKTPVHARMPGRDVFRLLNVSKDDISVNAAQYEREQVDFDSSPLPASCCSAGISSGCMTAPESRCSRSRPCSARSTISSPMAASSNHAR